MKKYETETIDHTADLGIKVFGKSIEELFENAAFGMFDVITDVENIDTGKVEEEIYLSSEDLNELLVEWLSELLFKFDTNRVLFSEFDVRDINTYSLNAKVSGEYYKEGKHDLKTQIKAVTYHAMNIKREGDYWTVEVIFDT